MGGEQSPLAYGTGHAQSAYDQAAGPGFQFCWVAVKELNFSYHSIDT